MRKSTMYILGSLLFIILSIMYIFYYNQQIVIDSGSSDILDNTITLRFSCSWGGFDSKSEILNNVIRDFEKEHPNIDIINESMFGEDFLFTLKTDFASGNGPDIFGLWPGSDREKLIQKGFVADLTPIIGEDPEWFDHFSQNAINNLGESREIYSIPFEIIYEGLFINIELFKKYSIKIPTNYHELQYAIKTFRKNDVIPIAYNSTPEGSFIYQNIVSQMGGKYSTEHPIDGNGNIRAAYIEAMYVMRTLYELDAFPENAFIIDDVTRNDMFMDGRAAMIVQGSWFAGDEMGKVEENIEIVRFPIIKERKDTQTLIYGIGNGNFHLNSATLRDDQKRDAAIIFFKFLTSKYSSDQFYELPGFMSSLKGETTYSDLLKIKGKALINNSNELVGPVDHYIDRTMWEEILVKNFPLMLDGEIEPEDIFREMGLYN